MKRFCTFSRCGKQLRIRGMEKPVDFKNRRFCSNRGVIKETENDVPSHV